LNRDIHREIKGFLNVSSLDPTLFQGRPSPLVDNR